MPTRRLIILIAGNFFVATSFLSVGGLLNDIAVSLAIPIERAGLLIAAFGISAAIFAPTLATLGSRIDRRVLLTGSMAICASAWTRVEPRFMPWAGLVFVLAALGCSMLGDRAAVRQKEPG